MTDRIPRRRDDALAARQRDADLRVLMEQPAFQRFIGWLLVEHCWLLKDIGGDRAAGRRSVATDLLPPLVNAERGVLSALLGTFLTEQGLDRQSDRPLSDPDDDGPAGGGLTALERGDAAAIDPGDPLSR